MKLPSKHDKDPKRRTIGQWIIAKRRAYHAGELPQLWIDKFEQTFPGWSWSPIGERVQKTKATLLAMAHKGEPRPSQKTPLGQALTNYIRKNSSSYDSEFDKEIRKFSHWFVDPNFQDERKKQLLEMARKGEPRPHSQKTKLGRALSSYLNKGQHSYDGEFEKEIQELSPSWFPRNRTKKNKSQLLKMAHKQEARPSKKTKLGRALCNYIGRNCGTYDGKFNKQIRDLAPLWFFDITDANKRRLLEMAREGEPRPLGKTRLYQSLRIYTSTNSSIYDSKFDKQIRRLAPHWFTKSSTENKAQLLEMARRGEPKPHLKTKLGSALSSYTGKSNNCYDPKFDKRIREAAPHWFVKTAEENKKQLLEMAHKKEPRPNHKTKLGRALSQYTGKTTTTYNAKFDKQIRKLAPHWFINTADEKKAQLLEMARKRKSKPHIETKLGSALSSYTRKSHACYNSKFDTRIRKLAPHWYES